MHHPQRLSIVFLTLFLLLTACNGNPLETIPGADSVSSSTTLSAPTPGANTEPRRFTIQEGASQVTYSVHEELFDQELTSRTTVGGTSQVEGEMVLQIDARSGGVAVGENQLTVNLESLTSNEERRDNRIRREWLESTTYPLATFVATDIQGVPAGIQEGEEATFQLVGDLTIRDITQSTALTTTAMLTGDTISGTATTLIYMRDFGFEPPNVMGILAVTDGVTVTLRFVMKESN